MFILDKILNQSANLGKPILTVMEDRGQELKVVLLNSDLKIDKLTYIAEIWYIYTW